MASGGSKVFVGNISSEVLTEDLNEAFVKFGPLMDITLRPGYAFLTFDEGKAADEAIRKMDGANFMGAKIRVERSRGRSTSREQASNGSRHSPDRNDRRSREQFRDERDQRRHQREPREPRRSSPSPLPSTSYGSRERHFSPDRRPHKDDYGQRRQYDGPSHEDRGQERRNQSSDFYDQRSGSRGGRGFDRGGPRHSGFRGREESRFGRDDQPNRHGYQQQTKNYSRFEYDPRIDEDRSRNSSYNNYNRRSPDRQYNQRHFSNDFRRDTDRRPSSPQRFHNYRGRGNFVPRGGFRGGFRGGRGGSRFSPVRNDNYRGGYHRSNDSGFNRDDRRDRSPIRRPPPNDSYNNRDRFNSNSSRGFSQGGYRGSRGRGFSDRGRGRPPFPRGQRGRGGYEPRQPRRDYGSPRSPRSPRRERSRSPPHRY